VHDFLLDVRGAERVFLELCAMWPHAELFTAVYHERGTDGRLAGRRIHTTYLQRLHPTARTFRALMPLYPSAIESLDLRGFDLVVSSSSAWAHGVICEPGSLHVSYCHNPFRYAWNERAETLAARGLVSRAVLRGVFRHWRQWDGIAAQRTDRYVANSRITQGRIRSYFGRESAIVHPPVDTERFAPAPVGDYYVLVSELMAHKQIDVAIAAFNRLRLPLVVIGDGPQASRLRRQAGPTITFTGRIGDEEVAGLLRGARALVVTSVEEFGIVAVESQASGRPVIARAGGGALETVVDGVTGCLWSGGPEQLAEAVLNFDEQAIDPEVCVAHAARFNRESFRRGIFAEIEAAAALQPLALDGGPTPPATRLPQRAMRESHR
jgi:glycosyltransferase involved in cell wall biosynthesis